MSRTYVQTANQIIARASRICGMLAEKQLLDNDQFDNGITQLNGLINFLSEKDSLLWNMTWATKALVVSSNVSNGGKYYRCILSHTAGASTQPGVGGNYTDVWYEDSSATTGAAAWATGTAYNCSGDFLVTEACALASAFLRYNGYDYPIKFRQFSGFLKPSEKWETGEPVWLYFDRMNTHRVYLSPIPDLNYETGVFHYLYIGHMNELTSTGDPIGIPPIYL